MTGKTMALVQSPTVPQADPWGLKWWVIWDDTTGSDTNPVNELVTEIHWDNTAGVARTVRITMKDMSVITAALPAGSVGQHNLNAPQQRSWLGIQFLA